VAESLFPLLVVPESIFPLLVVSHLILQAWFEFLFIAAAIVHLSVPSVLLLPLRPPAPCCYRSWLILPL